MRSIFRQNLIASAILIVQITGSAAAAENAGPLRSHLSSERLALMEVTPRGEVALFGTAVYVSRSTLMRVPVAELLTDSDGDGTIVFKPRHGVPFRSLWVAVDVENGSVAFATPAGYAPDQRQLDVSTLRKDADGLFEALEIERTAVELLLVRPRVGAWILRAREGAPTDGDRANDGRLTVLFDQAAPLGGGTVKAPNKLKAGDVLALLDPGQLELRILTIGK